MNAIHKQLLLFLLFYQFYRVSLSISCTGKILKCLEGSDECLLHCSNDRKVELIYANSSCSDRQFITTNRIGGYLKINTLSPGIFDYSCCNNAGLICSNQIKIYSKPLPADSISCMFEVNGPTVTSNCTVHQNGTFDLSVDISHTGNRENNKVECVKLDKQSFNCGITDAYLDKPHTIMVNTSTSLNNQTYTVNKIFNIMPINNVKHSRIKIKVIVRKSTFVQMSLRLGDEDYIEDICFEQCDWTCNVTYGLDLISTENNFVIVKANTMQKYYTIDRLQPNQNYSLSTKWKFQNDIFWSYESHTVFRTPIGVPKAAPHVVNYAVGENVIGIYIQKQQRDSYFGPINKFILNTTNYLRTGQRAKTNSLKKDYVMTLFVDSEKEKTSITLQLASVAGVSSNYTTIFIPSRNKIGNRLRYLQKQHYNVTHYLLSVDDIFLADSLIFYWCYGYYLKEKQIVDCQTSVQSESMPAKKTTFLVKPLQPISNCPDCTLHYAVAMEKDNKSGSMFWDSASEKIVPVKDLNSEIVIIIIVVVAGLILFGVCVHKCYKFESKHIPSILMPVEIDKVPVNTYPDYKIVLCSIKGETMSNSSSGTSSKNTSSSSFSGDSSNPFIPVNTDQKDHYENYTESTPCYSV